MPYPGGKAGAGVSQRIINLMPPHETYIEPFLGDAAVMRVKRPAKLNIGLDLDPESPGLAWLAAVEAACIGGSGVVGSSEERRRLSSVAARGSAGSIGKPDAGGLGDLESAKAARRPGVSSGLASSADAAGNGDAADSLLPSRRYRGGCLDGIEFLRVYPFTGKELVYCDPPYLMSTRSGRRLYKHEMTDVDHRRLLRVVMALPCMVMLSGYWSELYGEALCDWSLIHFESMTRGGHTATEYLWFNFPTPSVLHDDQFLGEGFRERERLKRIKVRWVARLKKMPLLDRQALLSAIASIDNSGD